MFVQGCTNGRSGSNSIAERGDLTSPNAGCFDDIGGLLFQVAATCFFHFCLTFAQISITRLPSTPNTLPSHSISAWPRALSAARQPMCSLRLFGQRVRAHSKKCRTKDIQVARDMQRMSCDVSVFTRFCRRVEFRLGGRFF